jgi:hypothetical protein
MKNDDNMSLGGTAKFKVVAFSLMIYEVIYKRKNLKTER